MPWLAAKAKDDLGSDRLAAVPCQSTLHLPPQPASRFADFMLPRWPQAPKTTLRRGCARTTTRTTTVHLSLARTDTKLRRFAPGRGSSLRRNFGGSGEIRTHGSLRIAGFQDRCNRPLCHASNTSVTRLKTGCRFWLRRHCVVKTGAIDHSATLPTLLSHA